MAAQALAAPAASGAAAPASVPAEAARGGARRDSASSSTSSSSALAATRRGERLGGASGPAETSNTATPARPAVSSRLARLAAPREPKDDMQWEWDQKHPFWPSLEKGGKPDQAPPKAPAPQEAGSTRNMLLHERWKHTIGDRESKIRAREKEKMQQLAQEISSSRALSEERLVRHRRKNGRIIQKRGARGDLVKRYNDLGPDVDDGWTATPFSRESLIDRAFFRLTDAGSSMSAVELWTFLQAMKEHVEVEAEADGPWTAGPFTASDFKRFVERTRSALGWRWSEEDEEGDERVPDGSHWIVLITAQQFQDFVNSPEVWEGNCPDDEALHNCYRDLLAQIITRPRLIKELFQKLDVDRYQLLHSKHLLHFARLYGFEGDEREWAKELDDLRHRFHWGLNGAAKGHFAALVSTREVGKAAPCYFCSSMRIDFILAQLEDNPPSLGDSRQVHWEPFGYHGTPYTPSVEFSPLSSRRESPRWEVPPRSPKWPSRQASPASVGSARPAGGLWSPAWQASPASAGSARPQSSPAGGWRRSPAWPQEPAAAAPGGADLDSFHQLLGGLKIPSAAELLGGGLP